MLMLKESSSRIPSEKIPARGLRATELSARGPSAGDLSADRPATNGMLGLFRESVAQIRRSGAC